MTSRPRYGIFFAAFALLLAACDGDEDNGSAATSTTGSSTTTSGAPPTGPLKPAEAETDLGPGSMMGLSPDGTAAYVAQPSEDESQLGCEGLPADVLFVVSLGDGKRSQAIGGAEPVSGEVLPRPGGGSEVAVIDQCEGFLTAAYLAEVAPDGKLSGLRQIPIPEDDHPTPRLAWSRDGKSLLGVHPDQGTVVRIDPATGRADPVRSGVPGVSQAAELADGELALLAVDKILIGPREVPVSGTFGFTVAPNGADLAVFGQDSLVVVPSGGDPAEVRTRSVIDATWSPDGTVVVYASEETLQAVTLAGDRSELAVSVADAGAFTPDGKRLVFTRIRPVAADGERSLFASVMPVERG